MLCSETAIFRQVDPGLVLLLIGETDEQGLPTATRTLICAIYSPEQELTRDGLIADVSGLLSEVTLIPSITPLPSAIPEPFAGLQVQLIEARYDEGWLETRLWLYNSGTAQINIYPDDIWVAFGYTAQPLGLQIPQNDLSAITLLLDQAIDLQLVWQWNKEPFIVLRCGTYAFAMELVPLT